MMIFIVLLMTHHRIGVARAISISDNDDKVVIFVFFARWRLAVATAVADYEIVATMNLE